MRRPSRLAIGLGAACLAGSAGLRAGGEIQGTVETVAGEKHSGTIEWPDGSRFWDETLDCGRPLAGDAPTEPKRDFKFSLFGVRLFHDDDTDGLVGFAVPFGDIRSIVPQGEGEASIELRNGETVRVRRTGADLGTRGAAIGVESSSARVEIPWPDVRRVELAAGRPSGPAHERLWGTATTKAGKFTGFVRWDLDESVPADELDGKTEGRDFSIAFREIAAIEPEGSRAAQVSLRSGRVVVLSGTNDVNADMRGLEIRPPGQIAVTIEWSALERLDLTPAPEPPGYERYDGGRALRGTVRLKDGTTRTGRVAWDRGERYTFETLDGEADGITYAIPFGAVAAIHPVAGGRAEVRLRDGRTLTLGGTNDVDETNRGIWIEGAADSAFVSYDALASLELDGPPAPARAAPSR